MSTLIPASHPTPSAARRPARLTALAAPPTTAEGAGVRSQTVDVVRAVCVLVVVTLHALMVGVERSPDGSLSTRVALAGTDWFAPVTWVIQIMPLFFIVGGFASAQHWRRARRRGGAPAFVVGRVRRLALPAAIMILVVGTALAVAEGMGVDPALLAEARLRIAQPLWFLAVYVGVTAMVPIMMRLHEWRPVAALLGVGSGIVVVDAVRVAADLPAVGFVNLGFVWLFMQQLGFLLSDGRVERWSSRGVHVGRAHGPGAAGVTAAAIPRGALLSLALLGLLVGVVTWGPYSADMLVNLNPPTAALALLGMAQFLALSAFKPRMDAWWDAAGEAGGEARRTAGRTASRTAGRTAGRTSGPAQLLARAGSAVSAESMTLYLWHMPLVLALAAVVWAGGLPLPEPHSGAWWLTRVPWLIALALALGTAYAARAALARLWRRAAPHVTVRRVRGGSVRGGRVTDGRVTERRVTERRVTDGRVTEGPVMVGRMSGTQTDDGWVPTRRRASRGATAPRAVGARGTLLRYVSSFRTREAARAVLLAVAAVVGVLVTLFCLGDVVLSTLISGVLLTMSAWSVHRAW